MSRSFTDRGAQTSFFATIDLAVNVLTLVVQIFLTGRIGALARCRHGPRTAARDEHARVRPARGVADIGGDRGIPGAAPRRQFRSDPAGAQVLFTVVPREDRYKAKSFIDTAVYRTGDQVGAWSYALIGGLGWGVTQAAVVAVVLSAAWLANSLWLGKRQEVLAEAQAATEREADGEPIRGQCSPDRNSRAKRENVQVRG